MSGSGGIRLRCRPGPAGNRQAAGAAIENIIIAVADHTCRICDSHAEQILAGSESPVANVCYTGRDYDTTYKSTAIKSITADARHAVFNHNGSDGFPVFIPQGI